MRSTRGVGGGVRGEATGLFVRGHTTNLGGGGVATINRPLNSMPDFVIRRSIKKEGARSPLRILTESAVSQ